MWALVLLIGHVGQSAAILDQRVDAVEVNYYFDDCGKSVFDQLIFWVWDDVDCRHQVIAWRLLKCAGQVPKRDFYRGGWYLVWIDGGKLRCVRSLSVRSTWTQFDPELAERKVLPQHLRPDLLERPKSAPKNP